jgi:hypothetical protein
MARTAAAIAILTMLVAIPARSAELLVGPSEPLKTLATAVAQAQPGDIIKLHAGEYTDDFAVVDKPLTITSVGGVAKLRALGHIANGKAILIVRAPVTVENLEFAGATVEDHNGAAIRFEAGTLTARNVVFRDNENGILSGAIPDGRAVIEDCEFASNGAGDGQSHGAYFGAIASLRVVNSQFHDTLVGSHLKSRAAETIVERSRFIDGKWGTANYAIDLPNGGNAVIEHNVFERAVTTSNRAMIHFGGEIDNPTGTLKVVDNQFTSDRPLSTGVLNQTQLPVEIANNRFNAVKWVAEGNRTVQHDNEVLPPPQ